MSDTICNIPAATPKAAGQCTVAGLQHHSRERAAENERCPSCGVSNLQPVWDRITLISRINGSANLHGNEASQKK